MKISKSKQELARIISENGGWCDGANIALFGKASGICYLLKTDEWPEYKTSINGFYINARDVVSKFTAAPFANWHQTILSRDEYFHLYPATDADDGWILWNGVECPVAGLSVVDVKYFDVEGFVTGIALDFVWGPKTNIVYYRKTRSESEQAAQEPKQVPVPESKPTIEQLAADYRNLKDYADRKQQEADAAMGEADAALELLYHAGLEIGLDIAIASDDEIEPELVITDWRDLRDGDVIEMLGDGWNCDNVGKVGVVRKVEGDGYNGDLAILCDIGEEGSDWGFGFKFIRRP